MAALEITDYVFEELLGFGMQLNEGIIAEIRYLPNYYPVIGIQSLLV